MKNYIKFNRCDDYQGNKSNMSQSREGDVSYRQHTGRSNNSSFIVKNKNKSKTMMSHLYDTFGGNKKSQNQYGEQSARLTEQDDLSQQNI